MQQWIAAWQKSKEYRTTADGGISNKEQGISNYEVRENVQCPMFIWKVLVDFILIKVEINKWPVLRPFSFIVKLINLMFAVSFYIFNFPFFLARRSLNEGGSNDH